MYEEMGEIILSQIDKTGRMVKNFAQREFDRLGLGVTLEQWALLRLIHENNKISQKGLSEKSVRDPASITRTLDLLQNKDFIERKSIPDNRRQFDINLTANGLKFILNNVSAVHRHRQKSLTGFTEGEMKLLDQLLRKIQDNLK